MDGLIVPLGDEDVALIQVHEYVKQCTDLPFIHIANERVVSPRQGALLKRKGVCKGVSDIFIPRANKSFHGLFIELKTLVGRPTVEQINFIIQMIEEGYQALVCYGSEQAIIQIKLFYGLK